MPSAISITFSPDEEAVLLAHAKALGITIESLVCNAVLQRITTSDSQQQLSGEAMEQALEDLADLIQALPGHHSTVSKFGSYFQAVRASPTVRPYLHRAMTVARAPIVGIF
ncbi:MAG: hypothetical protein U0R19_19595 [Bryobacteraceae bacterium]